MQQFHKKLKNNQPSLKYFSRTLSTTIEIFCYDVPLCFQKNQKFTNMENSLGGVFTV